MRETHRLTYDKVVPGDVIVFGVLLDGSIQTVAWLIISVVRENDQIFLEEVMLWPRAKVKFRWVCRLADRTVLIDEDDSILRHDGSVHRWNM